MYTFELNNERRDASYSTLSLRPHSAVVEVFSAMTDGKDLPKRSKAELDASVKFIKELNAKAAAGDTQAISEMNELRRFAMEPVLLAEIKLLGIFGEYQQLGYNDSAEIEIPDYANVNSNIQALGQDVTFPTLRKKRVGIATTTISGGYAVDYRKASLGDMSDENTLQEQIRTQIRNRSAKYIVEYVYNAIKNAVGVKYFLECAGLTKTGLDDVLLKVRRFGKPTFVGDYALISQVNGFAGYTGTTPNVTGIPDSIMEKIHNTGLMGMYNGAILEELQNEYDLTTIKEFGDAPNTYKNFETLLPAGLGFVIPAGGRSPIHTITRGGLTSFSGSDVTTGTLMTRYDMNLGVLVEPGREYQVGLIHDTTIDDLAD